MGVSIRSQEEIKRQSLFMDMEDEISERLSISWRQIVPTWGRILKKLDIIHQGATIKALKVMLFDLEIT